MHALRRLGVAVAAGLTMASAAWANPPPIEAYGGLEDIGGVSVSVDGTRVALLRPTASGGQGVYIHQTADLGAPPQLINPPAGVFVTGLRWGSDRHILLTLRTTQDVRVAQGVEPVTFLRLASVNLDTGATNILLRTERAVANFTDVSAVVSILPDDPDHILMRAGASDLSGNVTGQRATVTIRRSNIYRVNLDTGAGRRVNAPGAGEGTLIFSADGEVAARVEYEPNRSYEIFAREGRNWRSLFRRDNVSDLLPLGVYGLLPGGDALLVRANIGSDDFFRLSSMDMSNGQLTALGAEVPGYDSSGGFSDPYTNTYVGYRRCGSGCEQRFFDEEMEGWRAEIQALFPGASVSIPSWDRSRNVLAVAVEAPGAPTDWYLFRADVLSLEQLGAARPAIPDAWIAPVESLRYAARDGMQIEAFVTRPPAASNAGATPPVLLMPHGGPWARDYLQFDWLAQFFASRGYVVLQPNFRGSTGYGAAFERAGDGEFGGVMIDDMIDGVRALIAQGGVDAERVGVIGASYGGYAALMVARRAPEFADVAIAVNPVTDLPTLIADVRAQAGSRSIFIDVYERMMSDRFEGRTEEFSPARNAGEIRSPVLLLHSENDTTAPYEQSVMMERALSETGGSVRFVTMLGDDHYLAESASRLQLLREAEAFLAAHMP